MKKITIALLVLFAFTLFIYNDNISFAEYEAGSSGPVATEEVESKQQEPVEKSNKMVDALLSSRCPILKSTGLSPFETTYNNCTSCHIEPTWELKETSPSSKYNLPFYTKILFDENNNPYAYYILEGIDRDEVKNLFDYLSWHKEIKKVVIEIHSYGGSVFSAWNIVGFIESKKNEYEIETRVYGTAMSAGLLIFMSGESRLTSQTAEFMWHEISSWEMFAKNTPGILKDKAETFIHLQDTANNYIVSKSKITKDEIDSRIDKEEYWFNGFEAVELGLATGFIK